MTRVLTVEPGVDQATHQLRTAGRWWPSALRDLGVPLALYAVISAAHLCLLRWQLPPGRGLRAALTSWDGFFFLQVAEHGYPHHVTYDPAGHVESNRMAFFPLYPALVRLVARSTGLSYDRAGIAVSAIVGAAIAVLAYHLGKALYRPAAGVALTVLVCAQPLAIVFLMAYSEGLFLALALGMLLAIRRRAWLTAGGLCFAAGMTRPPGLAAAAALAVAAAMWLAAAWRVDGRLPAGWWRPVVATAVGAVAVPLYLLYVGLRLGRLDAWFAIQDEGWHTRFDGGRATARVMVGLFHDGIRWSDLGLTLILLAGAALTVVAFTERVWLPVAVFGLAVVAMALCADGIVGVKARYLLVAIAPLVPVAAALSRARRATAAVVLVLYAVVGVWYGSHVLAFGGLTI